MQRDNNGKPLGGVTGKGFIPGQSGNPGGRPKGSVKLSTCYERSLARPYPDDPEGRTYAQVIADKAVEIAAGGDIAAIREVTDRTEGRAKQTVDATVTSEVSQSQREALQSAAMDLAERHGVTSEYALERMLAVRPDLAAELMS